LLFIHHNNIYPENLHPITQKLPALGGGNIFDIFNFFLNDLVPPSTRRLLKLFLSNRKPLSDFLHDLSQKENIYESKYCFSSSKKEI